MYVSESAHCLLHIFYFLYLSSADPRPQRREEEMAEDPEDERDTRGGGERKLVVGSFTIFCPPNPSPLSALLKRFWGLRRCRWILGSAVLASVGLSAAGFCICGCMSGMGSLSASFTPIWSGLVMLGISSY